ncbi:hypothetical protein [Emcibacter sp.]|uniref:hypothetical protein n=1 Tax=Emcibacter sp. TaxID=1979954 RepID=UPI003A94F3F9
MIIFQSRTGPRTFPHHLSLLLSVLIWLAPAMSPANAEQRQWTEEQAQAFMERMEATRARLDLSPAQEEELGHILRTSYQERLQVLQKYGFSRGVRPDLKMREKISLGRDMKKIREKTEGLVGEILSEGQMREFRKIQDENRDRFREQMKNR